MGSLGHIGVVTHRVCNLEGQWLLYGGPGDVTWFVCWLILVVLIIECTFYKDNLVIASFLML